ncbi:MAG: urease accessory protein UreD [Leptolyngbyaceae cyanobacterium bins.59]|nr:urease accessory protein UreD [Leptolyngbyaceae cyanobacterium bins.59]
MNSPLIPDSASWHGLLDAEYALQQGQTCLTRSYARAPFKLQRPFYPEGPEVCHSVILHTAGGVVGGDRLSLQITLQPQTRALITTAAASKIYRSRLSGDQPIPSRQMVHLQVGAGACLEWFPQETIVFNGATFQQQVRVDLSETAVWMGWELTRLGRSARGEQFLTGNWRSSTEVWRGNRPLWVDPQWIPGDETILHSPHGLKGCPVVGSWAIVGTTLSPDLVEQARSLWQGTGETGVTTLLEGMLCRYRGHSTTEARKWFIAVWDLVRSSVLGHSACLPRVWPITKF